MGWAVGYLVRAVAVVDDAAGLTVGEGGGGSACGAVGAVGGWGERHGWVGGFGGFW